ncbi:MAG TPA: hypothetical protein VFR87_13125 [Nocardioidaceae bacterium]|nr:hypothetical protein [Nocardioidaceae bacterium]
MDQFMYVADPGRLLRMHNSVYLEQVGRAEWRSARPVQPEREEPAAVPVGESLHFEPTRRTRAAARGPRLLWRHSVHWRHHTGPVR